ncbi:hypothetical protein LZL87_012616 [Fusarium oxysporum]|nr:hypothetical protein LZL87_012616 [Fusarium oxysporum]
MHNPQNQKTSPVQTLREIIINIRDSVTISNIRVMNPRSLKSYVDLAIAQSSDEHIENIKVASSNQLKSGDLNIKTTTESYQPLELLARYSWQCIQTSEVRDTENAKTWDLAVEKNGVVCMKSEITP